MTSISLSVITLSEMEVILLYFFSSVYIQIIWPCFLVKNAKPGAHNPWQW